MSTPLRALRRGHVTPKDCDTSIPPGGTCTNRFALNPSPRSPPGTAPQVVDQVAMPLAFHAMVRSPVTLPTSASAVTTLYRREVAAEPVER